MSIYAQPPFVLGRLVTQMRGIAHVFYVEKTSENWVRRRPWNEALKRLLFSRADGIFATGPDARAYAKSYAAIDSRIFEVANATDIAFYAAESRLTKRQRGALRGQLGLRGITFVYAGRLWNGKGLKFLIDAYASLQSRMGGPTSLVLAGDGEDEGGLRTYVVQNGLSNVIFAGFRQRQQLAQIYGVSDVFVFPTLGDTYGMVVDEAMACGLPVVSTSTCGEISQRVIDGVTGYIVPPFDSAALCDRMARLGRSATLRTTFGSAGRLRIASRTPEHWAEEFESAVMAVMAMRVRRKVA